eukprot:4144133-Amphidinium_carterae.1
MAKHTERIEEDVASHAASCLKKPAEQNSAAGRQRQEGGVHAGVDREWPSPAYPLFKKKRH